MTFDSIGHMESQYLYHADGSDWFHQIYSGWVDNYTYTMEWYEPNLKSRYVYTRLEDTNYWYNEAGKYVRGSVTKYDANRKILRVDGYCYDVDTYEEIGLGNFSNYSYNTQGLETDVVGTVIYWNSSGGWHEIGREVYLGKYSTYDVNGNLLTSYTYRYDEDPDNPKIGVVQTWDDDGHMLSKTEISDYSTTLNDSWEYTDGRLTKYSHGTPDLVSYDVYEYGSD